MCNKSNIGNLSKQLFENDNQYVSLIILKLFFFSDYTYQVQSIFSVYSTQFIYLMYKNTITFFTYNYLSFFVILNVTPFRDAETGKIKTKMVGWNLPDAASCTIVDVSV